MFRNVSVRPKGGATIYVSRFARCFGVYGVNLAVNQVFITVFSQQSKDNLILVRSSQLFVGQHDGVEDNHLEQEQATKSESIDKSNLSWHSHIRA